MSRDDLLKTNADIVSKVVEEVVRRSPIRYWLLFRTRWMRCASCSATIWFSQASRDCMAGVLDSARMRCFLAEALDVSVEM